MKRQRSDVDNIVDSSKTQNFVESTTHHQKNGAKSNSSNVTAVQSPQSASARLIASLQALSQTASQSQKSLEDLLLEDETTMVTDTIDSTRL
jgi:hypothetical protein